MDILYAPWRESYVAKGSMGSSEASRPRCPFCIEHRQETDEQMFLVKRFSHVFVMMNLYPYNAGHLLVMPYRHVAKLTDLNDLERNELFFIASKAVDTLGVVVNAQGVNFGMNLGSVAGAGVPDHLHLHLVPRWQGDTNFMPIIAQTKQISINLTDLYQRLIKAFESF